MTKTGYPFYGAPVKESDEVKQLRAELKSAREWIAIMEAAARGKWLPIESAPKDGTFVLLFVGGAFPVVIARWYKPWENWHAGGLPIDPAREEYFGIGSAVPTHWQPLPVPPATDDPV